MAQVSDTIRMARPFSSFRLGANVLDVLETLRGLHPDLVHRDEDTGWWIGIEHADGTNPAEEQTRLQRFCNTLPPLIRLHPLLLPAGVWRTVRWV